MIAQASNSGIYNASELLTKYLENSYCGSNFSSLDDKRQFLIKFFSFYGNYIRRFILTEIKHTNFETPKCLFDNFIEEFLMSNKTIDLNNINEAVYSIFDEFDKFCKIYAPHMSQEMMIKLFNRDPASPYILLKNRRRIYYDPGETNAIKNQINNEIIEQFIGMMKEYLRVEPRCIPILSMSGRMSAWLHRWEEALEFNTRAYDSYIQDFDNDMAFFRSSLGITFDGYKEFIILSCMELHLTLGKMKAAMNDAEIIIKKDLKSLPIPVQSGLGMNATTILLKLKSIKSDLAEIDEPAMTFIRSQFVNWIMPIKDHIRFDIDKLEFY